MKPIRTTAVLTALAVFLLAIGHPALALVPSLAAALLAAFIVRVALRLHRQRRAQPVDVMDEARPRDIGDGRAIRDAQAAWMREQKTLTAESVIRAVQLARTEIIHAGAPEARAVLDELERTATEHPEGVNGAVVAAARRRFDSIMRANLQ